MKKEFGKEFGREKSKVFVVEEILLTLVSDLQLGEASTSSLSHPFFIFKQK